NGCLTRILDAVAVIVGPHPVTDLDRRLVAENLQIGHAGALAELVRGPVVGSHTQCKTTRQRTVAPDGRDALCPDLARRVKAGTHDGGLRTRQRNAAVERLLMESG